MAFFGVGPSEFKWKRYQKVSVYGEKRVYMADPLSLYGGPPEFKWLHSEFIWRYIFIFFTRGLPRVLSPSCLITGQRSGQYWADPPPPSPDATEGPDG